MIEYLLQHGSQSMLLSLRLVFLTAMLGLAIFILGASVKATYNLLRYNSPLGKDR